MRKFPRLLDALAVGACLLVAFRLGLDSVSALDTDFFWHLASGRYFCQSGSIPDQDPFSPLSDVHWLPYSWLCDIFTYWIEKAYGIAGLLWARVLLCLSLAGILLVTSCKVARRSAFCVAAPVGLVLIHICPDHTF